VAETVVSLADRAPAFEALGMGHGTPFEADGTDKLAALADTL
jgi:hypothetical protein